MAGRGSGDGAGAGAAWQFYLRHHLVLLSIALSVLGVATGVTTAYSLLQGGSLRGAAAVAAGIVLAGIVSWFHTRHIGLAILTALAPLPGLLWAAPISVGSAFGAVPLLAYVFAYGLSVMLAQDVLTRALDGSAAEYPHKSAAAAAGLAAALGFLWFSHGRHTGAAFQAVADIGFSGGAVLILMPMGEALLHFDENFVARANRTRERRQRWLEKIALVAVPRWGASIAGITLIFTALAWFGAAPAFSFFHFDNALALAGASAGLVFLIATAAAGGWREGLAATLAVGLVSLMTLWGFAIFERAPREAAVGISLLAATTLFLILCQARCAHAYMLAGDHSAVARLRAVEEIGGPQIFAVLGGLAMLLPSVVGRPIYAPYAVGLAFAGAAALAFVPALVTASEMLVARRRSVEDLYGRR